MKGGLEFGEDVYVRVGARKFFSRESEHLSRRLDRPTFWLGGSAVAIRQGSNFHVDGDGFVLEMTGSDGGECFPMGIGRELGGLFAGDAEFVGDGLRADDHVYVGVGMTVDRRGCRGSS